jgi:hypothetical protein
MAARETEGQQRDDREDYGSFLETEHLDLAIGGGRFFSQSIVCKLTQLEGLPIYFGTGFARPTRAVPGKHRFGDRALEPAFGVRLKELPLVTFAGARVDDFT